MVDNHYRWDFIGLSTDVKPTPETSEKVVDGSTFYCSDTSKLYVYCKDNWYERKPLGGGGGGGTTYTAGAGINIADDTISVDTTTIQAKLTAGSNVTISDNTISATDTTYSNFTGTDGTSVGTAGLVPAPATTDAGKFLKADGTWDTAGGGSSMIELTTSQHDYPVETPDGIALWKLNPGVYNIVDGNVKVYFADNYPRVTANAGTIIIISKTSAGTANIVFIPRANTNNTSTSYAIRVYDVSSAGVYNNDVSYLRNSLVTQSTGSDTSLIMSQYAVTTAINSAIDAINTALSVNIAHV